MQEGPPFLVAKGVSKINIDGAPYTAYVWKI